jgi:rsbT antagonist protein RsbS
MRSGPALFSVLGSGSYPVASVHTALDDTAMTGFRNDVVEQIGGCRSTGVIIDVAALDVLDTFGTTTIRSITGMARLCGALTAIVGFQPDVALAVARLGMGTGSVATAADLDDGVASLGRAHPRASPPPR